MEYSRRFLGFVLLVGVVCGFLLNSYLRFSAGATERKTSTGLEYRIVNENWLVQFVDCAFGWDRDC